MANSDNNDVEATQEVASTVQSASTKRKFSSKGFTSLLLAWGFVLLSFSGCILFVTPRGRDANWTDWSLLGLGKEGWSAVHINLSILFLVFAVVHLVLNWKIFWNYIKHRTIPGLNLKRELGAATAVTLLVVVGTICSLPPFSTVVGWNEDIKDYWSNRSAQAPVAHAEELKLIQFANTVQLVPEEVMSALAEEGYEVRDGEITMGELAEQKGIAPKDILEQIRELFPKAAANTNRGFGGGGGRLRDLTVAQLADRMGISVAEISGVLTEQGYDISDDTITMHEIAEQQGVSAREIIADIQEHFPDVAMPFGQGAGRGAGQGFGRGA